MKRIQCCSIQYHFLLIWFLAINIVYVNADYALQVRTHSYDNPTNRCADCGSIRGCCDDFDERTCTGNERCDNQFYYCLRELGSTGPGGCLSDRQESSTINNGGQIDFTQDVVLGLANPLPLNGTSLVWNGAQLFIESIDDDFGVRGGDDLIDSFQVDILATDAPVNVEIPRSVYNGIFGFATIELSFRVVCADNYYDPDCSRFCESNCVCPVGFSGEFCEINIDNCVGVTCSGRGLCEDGVDTFTCVCNNGFTGDNCEINIDDCNEIDCNGNGQCVDGISNFTCMCNSGFTGELCEINIDDCVGVNCSGNGRCKDGVDSFTCDCDPGFPGETCDTIANTGESIGIASITGAIAGGVGALILLLLVLIVIVVVVVIMRRKRVEEKIKPGSTQPGDNPSIVKTSTMESSAPDHDFDNPLYASTDVDNSAPDAQYTTTTKPNPSSNAVYANINGTGTGSTRDTWDFQNPIYGSPGGNAESAVYAEPN